MKELLLNIEVPLSLRNQYEERTKAFEDSEDSGFDLLISENQIIKARSFGMINLKVRCEPKFKGGFFLFPRSSRIFEAFIVT